MTRIFAAVPVKSLARAKSRLAQELKPSDRRTATLSMLEAVLSQLSAHPGIASWAVVSRDQDVLEVARQFGGEGLHETGSDLNEALEQARVWAAGREADGLLVLPGDVPFLQADDLAGLLALSDEHEVVIAPANDLGTNALLLRPPDAIPFRFGPRSSLLHRQEAERRGLAAALFERPTLAFDVDGPEDFRRYQESELGLACSGRLAERKPPV